MTSAKRVTGCVSIAHACVLFEPYFDGIIAHFQGHVVDSLFDVQFEWLNRCRFGFLVQGERGSQWISPNLDII